MEGIATTLLTILIAPVIMAWVGTKQEITLKKSLAQIEQQGKDADAKRDAARAETQAKRAAEAEWREAIDKKLSDMEDKLDRSIASQAAQTRSDIVHKCHRYLDDLGKASIEEKQALHDEHVQYTQFCDDLGIDNNFIDNLVARVMELPEREV